VVAPSRVSNEPGPRLCGGAPRTRTGGMERRTSFFEAFFPAFLGCSLVPSCTHAAGVSRPHSRAGGAAAKLYAPYSNSDGGGGAAGWGGGAGAANTDACRREGGAAVEAERTQLARFLILIAGELE
jgi:hypothetical protein